MILSISSGMRYDTCHSGKGKKKNRKKRIFRPFFLLGMIFFLIVRRQPFCMSVTTCMSFLPSSSASAIVAASL